MRSWTTIPSLAVATYALAFTAAIAGPASSTAAHERHQTTTLESLAFIETVLNYDGPGAGGPNPKPILFADQVKVIGVGIMSTQEAGIAWSGLVNDDIAVILISNRNGSDHKIRLPENIGHEEDGTLAPLTTQDFNAPANGNLLLEFWRNNGTWGLLNTSQPTPLAPQTATSATIPEPASLTLLGLGLANVIMLGQRKKRRNPSE